MPFRWLDANQPQGRLETQFSGLLALSYNVRVVTCAESFLGVG